MIGEYKPTFKPCPFCGGEAHYSDGIDPGDTWGANMRIDCWECDIHMWHHYPTYFPISQSSSQQNETKAYAALCRAQMQLEQMWNRRYQEAA